MSQDGGRFLGKTNYYTVVDINPSDVALLANERWFSREELREAYFTGEMNQHLIEALFNDFV